MDKQEFNIGDKVYHILPDSPQGIVFDVSYSFRYNMYKYEVVWDIDRSVWYVGDELSKNKSVV